MRRGRSVAALLGLVVVTEIPAWVRAGDGPDSRIDLTWLAPPECPSTAVVERAVARALGSASSHAVVSARAVVQQEVTKGYVAQLEVTTPQGAGVRTLSAADCAEVADAVALVIALAVTTRESGTAGTPVTNATTEPALSSARPAPGATPAATASGAASATTVPSPSAAGPVPPSPAASSPGPSPATVDYKARAAAGVLVAGPSSRPPAPSPAGSLAAPGAPRPHFTASALGVGDIGRMPRTDGGLALAVGWRNGLWMAEASGTWLASQTVDVGSGVGADLGLLGVGGRACLLARAGRLDAGPCLGARVDVLQGRAFGTPAAHESAVAWVAGVLGGHAAFWLTRGLALRLDADVGAPWTQPAFVITGAGHVHRPASIVGSAALGFEVGAF